MQQGSAACLGQGRLKETSSIEVQAPPEEDLGCLVLGTEIGNQPGVWYDRSGREPADILSPTCLHSASVGLRASRSCDPSHHTETGTSAETGSDLSENPQGKATGWKPTFLQTRTFLAYSI